MARAKGRGWISEMKRIEKLAPATIRAKVGALARCCDWDILQHHRPVDTPGEDVKQVTHGRFRRRRASRAQRRTSVRRRAVDTHQRRYLPSGELSAARVSTRALTSVGRTHSREVLPPYYARWRESFRRQRLARLFEGIRENGDQPFALGRILEAHIEPVVEQENATRRTLLHLFGHHHDAGAHPGSLSAQFADLWGFLAMPGAILCSQM